jgi:hypothetical protein
VAALWVHDEHLAVQVEQHIEGRVSEGRVSRLRHGVELSE